MFMPNLTTKYIYSRCGDDYSDQYCFIELTSLTIEKIIELQKTLNKNQTENIDNIPIWKTYGEYSKEFITSLGYSGNALENLLEGDIEITNIKPTPEPHENIVISISRGWLEFTVCWSDSCNNVCIELTADYLNSLKQ
jgi:hypothetical protein